MRYPALCRPITVGGLELKNRLVMSPMTTYGMPDPDGSSNERHRAYYEARARGGLGLIKTESALVHPSGMSWPHHLAIYDDRYIPGLAELARTIKRHGPPAIMQLHHGGRVAIEALSGEQPIAPSPLAAAGRRDVPREMTLDDIEQMIECYGQAARRAREAGYDGVEIHMGTAYLLLSFISPAQNVRQDEYGRDFEGRMRFPLRIVDRIRELCGPDYPIGARIVATDYHDGGVDLAYCLRVAQRLEQAGLAFLDVSVGQGPNAVRDSTLAMGYGEAVSADFAAAVKQVVSIPVMSVGRYYSLASAEAAVAAGKADLAVLGRALIADPLVVVKSFRGEEAAVIPCIGCQACHGGGSKGLGASCVLNPETGHEYELSLEPALARKRVLVVGSGVPGLELARVAALRGHEVTLANAGLPFGGLLALRSRVAGAEEVGKGVEYFRRTLAELGVRTMDDGRWTMDSGRPSSIVRGPSSAEGADFDVVVDARPGTPIRPRAEGLDAAAVPSGETVLAGEVELDDLGQRVAVIGPGIFAGETALFLAAAGKEVTLIAEGERSNADANPLIAGKTNLRFTQHGGTTIDGARVVGASDGMLALDVAGERRAVGPFDGVVAAIGWEPPAAPENGHGYVFADTWDAFAQLLVAFEATKAARSI